MIRLLLTMILFECIQIGNPFLVVCAPGIQADFRENTKLSLVMLDLASMQSVQQD